MLRMTEIEVKTVSGEKYIVYQDYEGMAICFCASDRLYTILSISPILIGFELRGECLRKDGLEFSFETDKVSSIVVRFHNNMQIRKRRD